MVEEFGSRPQEAVPTESPGGSMLERMAAAIAALPVRDWNELGGELDNLRLREAARAALLAIREPSEGMTNAAPEVDGIPMGGAAANVFTAMIDAILNEDA